MGSLILGPLILGSPTLGSLTLGPLILGALMRSGVVTADARTKVRVGSLTLPNPVMTASGTAGHGAELAPYGDLGALGAFVAKSLAAYEWAGNPAPRVHPTPQGMINAIGLQGPGITAWRAHELPRF